MTPQDTKAEGDDTLERLRLDYAPLLLRYLSQQDEAGLQAAYELGRRAMRDSVSLLEIVRVHHEVFLDVLATARTLDESLTLTRSSSALLIDLIAAFEMSHRRVADVPRAQDSLAEHG